MQKKKVSEQFRRQCEGQAEISELTGPVLTPPGHQATRPPGSRVVSVGHDYPYPLFFHPSHSSPHAQCSSQGEPGSTCQASSCCPCCLHAQRLAAQITECVCILAVGAPHYNPTRPKPAQPAQPARQPTIVLYYPYDHLVLPTPPPQPHPPPPPLHPSSSSTTTCIAACFFIINIQ